MNIPLCCVLSLAFVSSSSAIILYDGDNTANTSDPNSGVPYASVGRVTNSNASSFKGSAIHLGNGYMLTANHVGNDSHVTFDGTTFYTRDTSFTPVQIASGVDAKVFRLTTTPSVAAVNLLTTASEINDSTLVGWGVGRDPNIAINTDAVTWGTTATLAKRWGLNQVAASQSLDADGYTYDALITILGRNTNEAAATLYDSGSGLFQEIDNTWYLVGLTTAVEINGTSTFGVDNTTSPSRGDANFFVRISSYDTAILAAVPEPTATGLLILSAASALALCRRRKRAGR